MITRKRLMWIAFLCSIKGAHYVRDNGWPAGPETVNWTLVAWVAGGIIVAAWTWLERKKEQQRGGF
jgi:hypothetical protein